jgi:hypothetical protein
MFEPRFSMPILNKLFIQWDFILFECRGIQIPGSF